jgi:hypothetical protein
MVTLVGNLPLAGGVAVPVAGGGVMAAELAPAGGTTTALWPDQFWGAVRGLQQGWQGQLG